MLPAILSVLEEDVTRAAAPNATKPVRDKGADAAEMRGRLYNETSLLRLAGTVDIYEVFGNLVNAAQQFRLLPHQRLDRVRGILEDWTRMTEHIEDSDCLGKEDTCNMKHFHQSLASLKDDLTINGVLVLDKHPVRAAALNARTRRHQTDQESAEDGDHVTKVKAELKHLSTVLNEDLNQRMVSEEEVDIIENTRTILDFVRLLKEMKDQQLTTDIYAAASFPKFLQAAQDLKIPSLEFIPDSVLENQYRNFIKKLVNLVPDEVDKDKIDPRQILSTLISDKNKLYEDIQCVLHVMTYCATKSGCESVLESYVSQYEYTIDRRKNFNEENRNDCFEIVKNGPLISKCDRLVKIALKNYFKDKPMHFVTQKFYVKSKVVTRKETETSQLIFMD